MHSKITLSNRARAAARKPLTLALIAALGLAPLAASAATITVSSPGDTDPATSSTCTLRQAIATMNHGASAGLNEGYCRSGASNFGNNDTIVFDSGTFPADGSGTIMLVFGRLAISAANLTVDASVNSNVTINAHGASGVIGDSAAVGGSLTLKHLSLTNGNVAASTNDCINYGTGGGICILDANLLLDNSTLSGNSVSFAGGGIVSNNGNVKLINSVLSGNSAGQFGGGIVSVLGSVTLDHSSLSGNVADKGGGIFAQHGNITLTGSSLSSNRASTAGGGIGTEDGLVTLTNSTLHGNSASHYGGSIASSNGSVALTNSTLSGNVADNNGGAIAIYGTGSVALTNSTLSGNSASTGGGIYLVTGSISANNSIVSGNSGGDIFGFTPVGDHNLIGNVPNLNLGPLRDNGGLTQTMMLQIGSVAIDSGDLTVCPSRDQRGVLRPQNAGCDIGAVEASIVGSMTYLFGSNQIATAWHDFTSPLAVQVFGPTSQLAPGVSVHVTAPSGTGQASAICTDAISNDSGLAYLYCRANGVAGTYDVTVQAVGWASVASVTFTLTNAADSDAIFRDGFDPPGPRTLLKAASDNHD